MQHKRQLDVPSWRLINAPALAAGGVLVPALVFLGGWWGGTQYQKQQDSSAANSSSSLGSRNGVMGGPTMCTSSGPCSSANGVMTNGKPPVIGKITAVSPSSITIQPSGGGGTQTFSITSSTQEMKSPGQDQGPSAYNASDFSIGQTVGVVPGNNDSTQAQMVLPNFQATNQIITGPGN